jgi:ABC-type transport system involved in multi-copper enzyme maturation permease subunit
MLDLQLVSAEVLKLRRRRGMLAIAILLTLGLVLLVFGVTAVQHASNPDKYDPAGGAHSFADALTVIALMASVIGVIIGGTAGTQDIESGVFRDLAATGRSRLALFGARVTGAWAIVLPILAVTMAALTGLAIALAGSTATPTAAAVAAGTAGILVAGALSTAMAVGLSAVVGSRGPVIGILLAFFLALQPLLAAIGFLGAARQGIPSVAIERIGHMTIDGGVSIALGAAIAVTVAWVAATLGLGAWKTRTREI